MELPKEPDCRKAPSVEKEPLTVLSEVAYPGPSKEDLMLLNAQMLAKRQQTQITIDDVIKGFRELGKDMESSDLLTNLLRALAKGETEDLFDWLLRERFKDNPPADGMGHWERLCSVIPNLDRSWKNLPETYEIVVRASSEVTDDEYAFGPVVTWSTISPNSNRHWSPSSPVQPPSSPGNSFARSPLPRRILSPTSQRRKRATPKPSFEPPISVPKPLGENEMQEASERTVEQPSKKVKLPPCADLPLPD